MSAEPFSQIFPLCTLSVSWPVIVLFEGIQPTEKKFTRKSERIRSDRAGTVSTVLAVGVELPLKGPLECSKNNMTLLSLLWPPGVIPLCCQGAKGTGQNLVGGRALPPPCVTKRRHRTVKEPRIVPKAAIAATTIPPTPRGKDEAALLPVWWLFESEEEERVSVAGSPIKTEPLGGRI